MSDHMHWVSGAAPWSKGSRTLWAKALLLVALAAGVLVAGFGPTVPSAAAASTTTVDLGRASTYAVLSGASVGNTVNAPGTPFTTLRGDLGVLANAQPTGFPPGVVTGTTRVGSTVTQAYNDLVAAYNDVGTRTGGTALAADLAGLTLAPGLHANAGAVANTGTVILDGGHDPNAIFVFKIGGALTMAAGARVTLANGTQASHVFWQVNGAGAIGAGAKFAGTLMAHDAVAIGAGTEVNGRALALTGAVSLDSNDFYSAPPVVTITGGATAIANDPTPTISGTTDVAAPGVVTVTIAGQTLTATATAGAWSVTSPILANGTYQVGASVTDGAGNPGSATQQLTIDTVPPIITIDHGASVTTNDPTPTIAGTSDAAPDTVIRVTVDSQTLTALVQSAGTWNVTPSALSDGTRTVTAAVTDRAGNQSTASQVLTVDTVAPAVTIAGGANALTNDATPDISGIAAVAPGTIVTVTLADQTLTGLVQVGGAWSVIAAALPDGPHRVVMSVSDAAGNLASFTQTLTIDTVAPIVTITGGATATTNNDDPTISGTSDAAPGTIVTVSIAGQTMTTLLQNDGRWNATSTSVGKGTWQVLASAPDPAGNVGIARQTLTIDSAPTGSGSPGSTGGPGPADRLAVIISCAAVGHTGNRCKGSLSATSRVTSRSGKPEQVTAALAPANKNEKQQPKSKTELVRVASGSYSVANGQRATITLALNNQGRKLLALFYRVPATLKIDGSISATHTITFSYIRVRAGISARWAVTKGSTSVHGLTVSRLPAKSKVTVTCHGGGCPFAKRTFSPTAKSLALAPKFGNAKLKPGTTVEITVSVAGQVGSVAGFTIRSGRPPTQTSLCLVPGAPKPTACATP